MGQIGACGAENPGEANHPPEAPGAILPGDLRFRLPIGQEPTHALLDGFRGAQEQPRGHADADQQMNVGIEPPGDAPIKDDRQRGLEKGQPGGFVVLDGLGGGGPAHGGSRGLCFSARSQAPAWERVNPTHVVMSIIEEELPSEASPRTNEP